MKTTNKIQICMAIFSLLFLCGASVSHADTFSVSINNNNLSPDGARIVCFIVTHSQQVPVVAVANNDGFPKESTVAASQNSYQGQDGINVSIVLVLGLA